MNAIKRVIKRVEDKPASFWQKLLTIALAANGIILTLLTSLIIHIALTQEADGKELVRVATVQLGVLENNELLNLNQGILKADVASLKLDWVNAIKDWTEDNYIRKPQK